MSDIYHHWKVKCSVDSNFYETITVNDTEPTICPDNSLHSVVANSGIVTKKVPIGDKKLSLEDGRTVVSLGKFPDYYNPCFTSYSDDFANGTRLDGENMIYEWADGASATNTVDIRFIEPVTILGGYLYSNNANKSDYINFDCIAPATQTSVNLTTTGNCNLVALGVGKNIIVPAAGNGTHDVDITSAINVNLAGGPGQPTLVTAAVPVPAFESDGVTPNGYWDWDEITGAITVNATGTGYYNLFDFEINLSTYVNKVCVYGGDSTVPFAHPFIIDDHRGGHFIPQWKCVLTTTRDASHDVSDPAVFYSVILRIARRNF